MPRKTAPDLFAELRKIDTPTITNVVATYPTNPHLSRALQSRGARIGTLIRRCVACILSWGSRGICGDVRL